jgi:hypothetical protein
LLVIHREAVAERAAQVGRLAVVTKTRFDLAEIHTDARWDITCRYKYSDLTMVGFGGRYEDTLARVAAAESES